MLQHILEEIKENAVKLKVKSASLPEGEFMSVSERRCLQAFRFSEVFLFFAGMRLIGSLLYIV